MLKRKKVVTLRRNRSVIMSRTRRKIYAAI
jgi:hypothetical protein